MKKFLVIFLSLIVYKVTTQNKQILYGFDKIPQGLLVNPGAETEYKYHVGVPILSGISANIGLSGFTVADLFRNDNLDFNQKLNTVLNNLGTNDYVHVNSQIEVINGGYQMNKKDYLSVGYYTELDAFITIPRDFLFLIRDGNAGFINKSFLFSKLSAKIDVLGVIHAGITRKFNEKFIAGARFKIYSGALNITSTGNQGSFTTRLGASNIYEHSFNNLDVTAYSSGIYNSQGDVDIDGGEVIGSTFLGGNLGVGFDIGFTYKMNDQTQIAASLLDVGFISYSENTNNGFIKGNYLFSGIEFQYDAANPNYWQDLNDDFDANIIRKDNTESYTVLRPIKFNAAIKHGFGKSRREENCADMSFNDYYDNAVGLQLYSIIQPIGPRFAATGFYERKITKNWNTKVTYTIDDFSYSNFGLGVSANVWKLNIYGMVDNVLKLSDIANANNASFQLGINVIFK